MKPPPFVCAFALALLALGPPRAPAAPARPAPPPGFLGRLPAPLNAGRWREIGPLHRAVEMDWGPLPYGLISPGGRSVLQTEGLGGDTSRNRQPIVSDLETGETRVVTLEGDALYRVTGVHWDPLNPAFIYGEGIRHTKGSDPDLITGQGERGIWRVRVDGTHVSRVSKPGEDAGMGPLVPDGRLVLYIPGPADAFSSVTQVGVDVATRKPIDWSATRFGLNNPSPSGEFLAGRAYFQWATYPPIGITGSPEFAKANLSVYEIAANRRAVVFTDDQVSLSLPPGTHAQSHPFPPRWLPDSSGFLVSLRVTQEHGGRERWQLWKVAVPGEAHLLLHGLHVTASSANGRHWIFEEGQRHYLVSVPAGAARK